MITGHLAYCIKHLPKTKQWFDKDDCCPTRISRAAWVLIRLEEEGILKSKVTGNLPTLKRIYQKTKKYFDWINENISPTEASMLGIKLKKK